MNITLNCGETSGKQAFLLVQKAVKEYSKKTGLTVTIQDFCRASGISKQQLYAYRADFHKPGEEGLAKIAKGLTAWGNQVTINH